MYLLDTNVISELRNFKPHDAVLAWFQSVPSQSLHLSTVVLGEIQAGIELTRENDLAKALEIEVWLDGSQASFSVLDISAEVNRLWAKLTHCKADHHDQDAMIEAQRHRL